MTSSDPVFTDINPEFIQANLSQLGCTIACWEKSLNIARMEINDTFSRLSSTVPFSDDLSAARDRADNNLDDSANKLKHQSVFYMEFNTHFPHESMDTLCDECWCFQRGVGRLIEIAKGGEQSAKETSLHFQNIAELHLEWMAK
jgi:hypothetical protein